MVKQPITSHRIDQKKKRPLKKTAFKGISLPLLTPFRILAFISLGGRAPSVSTTKKRSSRSQTA